MTAIITTSSSSSSSSNGDGSNSSACSTASTAAAAAAAQASYAAAVRAEVSALGPLWVKLGQTLSVRPDVIGPHLAAALSQLQEGALPFDDATAATIITQELGSPPSQLFCWMSTGPVASASLGQVYQAQLVGPAGGTLVAVKVQRPGVWQQLQLDLSILLLLLRLLKAAARIQQDITAWADTLGHGLAQELDYEQEAHNLEQFAAAHSHLGFVATPAVVWPLTSTRVLTTTWMDGATPGQLLQQARHQNSCPSTPSPSTSSSSSHPTSQQLSPQQQLMQLVQLGVEASLAQLVMTRVLHADPHPGNLLLTPQGQLAYLDFGLLAMMSGLLHWAVADWRGLAGDLGDMGLLKATTDRRQLAEDLQQSFEVLHSRHSSSSRSTAEYDCAANSSSSTSTSTSSTSTSSTTSSKSRSLSSSVLLRRAGAIGFGDFAGVIARLAVKYRFELPSYYTLVIRSLTTLEGFALVVDSNARQQIAQWAVRAVARQLLSDDRSAALPLLQQLLLDPEHPGQLNLPLLEELLLLYQQHSSKRASSPGLQQRQLPMLVALVSEMDPRQLARQLSSQQAAVVRRVAAEELLQRLLPAAAAALPSPPPAAAAAVPADVGNLHKTSSGHKGSGSFGQTASSANQQQKSNSSSSSSSTPFTIQPGNQSFICFVRQAGHWLLRAGPRGLLLVVQFVGLAAALVASRALQALTAGLRQRPSSS